MLSLLAVTSTANAITVEELYGKYELVANGSTNNGANGFPIGGDINVIPYTDADESSSANLIMTGFFGKNCTIYGTFDANAKTITVGPDNYVEGFKTPITAYGFYMFWPVIDGTPNQQDDIVFNVSDDGVISFSQNIGVVYTDLFGSSQVVLETLNGGKLTRKTVQSATASELEGKYDFSAATDDVWESEENADFFGKTKSNNFTLTVKKAERANEYTISGFFGVDSPAAAVFYPECNMFFVNTNSSHNGLQLDDTYSLGTMQTNLYFDYVDGKLITKNQIVFNGQNDDGETVNFYAVSNGVATKNVNSIKSADISSDEAVDVYTVDGKLVKKNAKALNLEKGVYILKTAQTTKKVVL